MKVLIFLILFSAIVLAKSLKLSEYYRIVGGKYSMKNQLPYMALIAISTESAEDDVICGGSLISNNWVLSAAHCTSEDNIIRVKVFLGSINLWKGFSYDLGPENIINHEQFDPTPASENDISLIKIPFTSYTGECTMTMTFTHLVNKSNKLESFAIPDSMKNIPLPFFLENELFDGVTVTASGWGYISNKGPLSNKLKQIDLIVMQNDDCKKSFQTLSGTQMCAATRKKQSPCIGDSGGPLVYHHPQLGPIQIGIMSFLVEIGVCENGDPLGNTRVTSHLNWIRDKTGIDFIQSYNNIISAHLI